MQPFIQTTDETRPVDRAARWERLTALPLTILSILFLAVYAAPILRPDLPAAWRLACEVTTVVVWLLFWVDLLARLKLSTHRRRFLRDHLFDLTVLVLPVLRPLRALRLVTAVLTISRRTETWARGRLAVYVGTTTLLLVLVSALAVLDAERASADANISSFDDALWWSAVTITTVGYGDHYPVTAAGRFVALALMIGGIGLIGFVTGSLATWIVERVSDAGRPAPATVEDIAVLRAEIAALREQLGPGPTGTGQEPDRQSRPAVSSP
ncbi:potassium channel family protein [Micromonospora coxensis]|uniref:Voltage-gated potassium channel n=1 Tax=Micromonospora coxensis TaxID=356852 RepID=A0A1C5GZY2_9ACTN|nr:potassium channel family protein [Micromonospora coxensis]SCG39310.1 voltage-gated potassium channel [Micromonospora coxensis]